MYTSMYNRPPLDMYNGILDGRVQIEMCLQYIETPSSFQRIRKLEQNSVGDGM